MSIKLYEMFILYMNTEKLTDLVKSLGGSYVYIPVEISNSHFLYIYGENFCSFLTKKYGKKTIYFPKKCNFNSTKPNTSIKIKSMIIKYLYSK